jgi:uncharacterized Zn finger protein
MSYYSRRSSRYSRSSSRYDRGYSYYGFAPYVPVAVRRAKALDIAKKAARNGTPFSPVEITGRTIAATFWGKAWCRHLESYSDYENRLPRGRTYVRNGSVIDLQITKGKITAKVSGSEIYTETITIKSLAPARWESIKQKCAGRIDSLVDLLKGKLSDAVMRVITDRDHGLFPAPGEIEKDCSCPDSAGLCKHLAAVLYGVGARLDTQPELLFLLRGVDHRELIAAAAAGATRLAPAAGATATLSESQLADVFGIDIAPAAHSAAPAALPPPATPASAKPAKSTKPARAKKPSTRSSPPAKKTSTSKKPTRKAKPPIQKTPRKKTPLKK